MDELHFSGQLCAERHARIDARLRRLEEMMDGNGTGEGGMVTRLAVISNSLPKLAEAQHVLVTRQDTIVSNQEALGRQVYRIVGGLALLQVLVPVLLWLATRAFNP